MGGAPARCRRGWSAAPQALSGFNLPAAIKKDPRFRHTPVLFVAAEPRKDDIVRAVQAGAGGVLVERFTRAVLEERLCQIAPDLSLQA